MTKYRYQYESDDITNHKLAIFSDVGEKVLSGLDLDHAAKTCSLLNANSIRLDAATLAEKRYEKVRVLTPEQFKDLYLYNLYTGKTFDSIIDNYNGYSN